MAIGVVTDCSVVTFSVVSEGVSEEPSSGGLCVVSVVVAGCEAVVLCVDAAGCDEAALCEVSVVVVTG